MTSTAQGALVARTRPLDEPVDLLDVCGDHGLVWLRGEHGLAGRGVAREITVSTDAPGAAAEAVTEALAEIEHDDAVGAPGAGPVAIGALPFTPATPGVLTIPALLIGRSPDGGAWVTTIGEADQPVTCPSIGAVETTAFAVTPRIDPADWIDAVERARLDE